MRFELDAEEKTIIVKKTTNIKELIDFIKEIKDWEEYTIISDIITTTLPSYPYEPYPWPQKIWYSSKADDKIKVTFTDRNSNPLPGQE